MLLEEGSRIFEKQMIAVGTIHCPLLSLSGARYNKSSEVGLSRFSPEVDDSGQRYPLSLSKDLHFWRGQWYNSNMSLEEGNSVFFKKDLSVVGTIHCFLLSLSKDQGGTGIRILDRTPVS
jgi:hypothetical protein